MSISYSVVIPAYRCGANLVRAIEGLLAATVPPGRIVVVDDASGDDTAEVARRYGVRVEELSINAGPARARNCGASLGTEEIIIFVDADVVVHPDAIVRLLQQMQQHPAVFGSYDTAPAAPGRISRIRNLIHHWNHQQGAGKVVSFWTGLGAIRRAVFEEVGGFDERLDFMEDVDLGMRLWQAGHEVMLDPTVLGTHLKEWTLRSMLKTDFWGRAIPWSRLMLAPENRNVPKALNAEARGKYSVVLVALSLLGLVGMTITPWAFALFVLCLLGIALLHRTFLTLLSHIGKSGDQSAAIVILWLMYLMAGLGFAYVLCERWGCRPRSLRPSARGL